MRKSLFIILATILALCASCNLNLAESPTVSAPNGAIAPYTSVVINTSVKDAHVRYTLDGTDPTYESKRYESPIVIIQNTVLKAAAFKNEKMVSTISEVTYQIQGSAGGIVFYDCDADNDSTNDGAGPDNLKSSTCGWRYLEVAPADITDGTTTDFGFGFYRTSDYGTNWYVNGSTTYVEGTEDPDDGKSTGTAIGTGRANTTKLVKAMGDATYSSYSAATTADYAAKLCDDYAYGGYSDWFLPSKEEMLLMLYNLHWKGIGGFSSGYYWSSSEYYYYADHAWAQSFNPSLLGNQSRVDDYRVRAIRAFN